MGYTITSTETNVILSPTITKDEIGLGNVDNTSDLNKPISTAQQAALDAKADVGHTHPGLQGDVTYRQATAPATNLVDGDTWYHTTTHEYYVRRDGVWEEIILKNELDGAFGATTMNGGNF